MCVQESDRLRSGMYECVGPMPNLFSCVVPLPGTSALFQTSVCKYYVLCTV